MTDDPKNKRWIKRLSWLPFGISIAMLMSCFVMPPIVYWLVTVAYYFLPPARQGEERLLSIEDRGTIFGFQWYQYNGLRYWASGHLDRVPQQDTTVVPSVDGWTYDLAPMTSLSNKAFINSSKLVTCLLLLWGFGATIGSFPQENVVDIWMQTFAITALALVVGNVPNAVVAWFLGWLHHRRRTQKATCQGQVLDVDGQSIHLANAGTSAQITSSLWGSQLEVSNPTEKVIIRAPFSDLVWIKDQIGTVGHEEALQVPNSLRAAAAKARHER